MKLTYQGIREAQAWRQAGIALPGFDWPAMCMHTTDEPVWVHFGAGNIFRGFIAGLQQRLLNKGLQRSGIVAAETFDYDIIDRIYVPHDSMTLMVSLKPDGETEKEVIASIANGLKADCTNAREWKALKAIFENPSLQMASFTITEKGYGLRDMKGQLLPVVVEDLKNGPEQARHAMSVVAAMMLARFRAGARPMALVSMDNCSHNGEKLRQSVLEIARGWRDNGLVPSAYVDWMSDEENVSFPWSMIDKITPRPSEAIEKQLEALGVEGMTPIITGRRTYIAPFVNAEVPQYLVVEDRFPNGRPPLEQAGVYMTDRDTVNRTERMKVTTCLNPLHTALAVYGCLLGYTSIAAEMGDADLKALVEHIAAESLPVVEDPGILSPRAFIDEVLHERFPNPAIPDTPQRIAADTSQKLPVRYGGTLRRYARQSEQALAGLEFAPLVFAGWCRYLLGVDDRGNAMPVSPDPMLPQLQAHLKGIEVGRPDSLAGQLRPILSNAALFGVDLYAAGLGERTEEMFRDMLAGPGAVRATLHRNCACKQP